MSNRIEFDDLSSFALFCAELARQNIVFAGAQDGGRFYVTIKGY